MMEQKPYEEGPGSVLMLKRATGMRIVTMRIDHASAGARVPACEPMRTRGRARALGSWQARRLGSDCRRIGSLR